MKIFNSLTGKKETFKPKIKREVSIYICGLTPYDDVHIGHARTFINFDVIVKFLRFVGFKVKYVRNITDVDDKIINRAKEEGIPALDFSKRFIKEMHNDFFSLGIDSPDVEPKVSDHIEEIISMIQSLEEKIKFPSPINRKGSKLKTAIFGKTTYNYPESKKELIEFISKEKNYTILSGGTDWNLEAEDSNFKEQKILFLNNIKEMSTIKTTASSFEIGACVTLSKFEELCREFFHPFLDTIIRFGSPQIRTAATVGGNLGTSSPIGDLAPLFFALEAELSLLGPKGERTISIKDFFKGYRTNSLKNDELIFKVKVPKTKKGDLIFSWKLSKRYDQDISTLSLAAKLTMDKNQTLENIILSAGGVGPTPLLLDKTSKLLKESNLRFNQSALLTALNHDISPISDLRGTAKYRSAAMVGLIKKMQRCAISGEKQYSIMSI